MYSNSCMWRNGFGMDMIQHTLVVCVNGAFDKYVSTMHSWMEVTALCKETSGAIRAPIFRIGGVRMAMNERQTGVYRRTSNH